MVYGVYKNARNAAWQCLIDYNVSALPVKVTAIAKQAGIKIIKNCKIDILPEEVSGMTIFDDGQFYIVYRDGYPPRARFTIAHEMGHIFLGHLITKDKAYRSFAKRPEEEQAADVFARDLLAPACVLHELQILKPEQIAHTCEISLQAAQIRAERMRVLEQRGAWYLHPLERQVQKQFDKFIFTQKR